MNRIALGLAAGLVSLTAATAAFAQDTNRYTLDYLIGPTDITAYFKPEGSSAKCGNVDDSETTPRHVIQYEWRVIARSLIHEGSVGYVYWVTVPNAGHRVFFATYMLEGCKLKENKTDEKAFVGQQVFEQARKYYGDLLLKSVVP